MQYDHVAFQLRLAAGELHDEGAGWGWLVADGTVALPVVAESAILYEDVEPRHAFRAFRASHRLLGHNPERAKIWHTSEWRTTRSQREIWSGSA
jgi:hypothetical protein